jgi:hypothetical protein
MRIVMDGTEMVLNDGVIAPTYQAFDIADITKIKMAFTNTFTLPYCNVNNAFFENAFRVQSNTNKRYLSIDVFIYVGSRQILVNGVAEFLGTDNSGYKIVCYEKENLFFNLIGGESIRSLDYTGFDHLQTPAAIAAYFNKTSDFVYPLINYLTDANASIINGRAINVRFLPPCLFYHQILEKIFVEAGYGLVNNTKDYKFFDDYDLIFTTDNKNNYLQFLQQVGSIPAGNSYSVIWDTSTKFYKRYALAFSDELFFGESKFFKITESEYLINLFNIDTSSNQLITAYTITPIETTVFNFFVKFDAFFGNINPVLIDFMRLKVYEITDSTTVINSSNEILSHTFSVTLTGNEEYSYSFNLSLTQGKRYILFLEAQHEEVVQPFFTVTDLTIRVQQTFRLINSIVPDIQKKDFIKAYLILTGSTLTFNSITNVFTIERFDKVIENKAIAIDWTDKVYDNTVKAPIEHSIGNYAVSNKFTYKRDENDIEPNGATGFINCSNQNLDKEKLIYEMPFAGSLQVNLMNGLSLPKINLFKNKIGEKTITLTSGDVTVSIPLLAEIANEIVPRLLLLKRVTLPILEPVGYFDESIATAVLENRICLAHFVSSEVSNLGFGNNILDNFYQWLQSILDAPLKLNEGLKLTAEDISPDELDYLVPIYLQQHNAYFYRNRISNFVEDNNVKTELIKI